MSFFVRNCFKLQPFIASVVGIKHKIHNVHAQCDQNDDEAQESIGKPYTKPTDSFTPMYISSPKPTGPTLPDLFEDDDGEISADSPDEIPSRLQHFSPPQPRYVPRYVPRSPRPGPPRTPRFTDETPRIPRLQSPRVCEPSRIPRLQSPRVCEASKLEAPTIPEAETPPRKIPRPDILQDSDIHDTRAPPSHDLCDAEDPGDLDPVEDEADEEEEEEQGGEDQAGEGQGQEEQGRGDQVGEGQGEEEHGIGDQVGEGQGEEEQGRGDQVGEGQGEEEQEQEEQEQEQEEPVEEGEQDEDPDDPDEPVLVELKEFERKKRVECIRYLVRTYMRNDNVPAMAVAVRCNGEEIFNEGFGVKDIENQIDADEDMRMDVASITKIFTAYLIMKEFEEQRWVGGQLDENAAGDLLHPDDEHTFSLSQLLWHLADLRHYTNAEHHNLTYYHTLQDAWWSKYQFFSPTANNMVFVPDIASPVTHAPGEQLYSSLGYDVLGATLEMHSDMPYYDFAMLELARLSLNNMYLNDINEVQFDKSRGYEKTDKWEQTHVPQCFLYIHLQHLLNLRVRNPFWDLKIKKVKGSKWFNSSTVDYSMKYASEGLVTTVGDLVKFGDLFSRMEQDMSNGRPLSQALAKLMWSYRGETCGALWKNLRIRSKANCLGWKVNTFLHQQARGSCRAEKFRTETYHSGSAYGYLSYLYVTTMKRCNYLALDDYSFAEPKVFEPHYNEPGPSHQTEYDPYSLSSSYDQYPPPDQFQCNQYPPDNQFPPPDQFQCNQYPPDDQFTPSSQYDHYPPLSPNPSLSHQSPSSSPPHYNQQQRPVSPYYRPGTLPSEPDLSNQTMFHGALTPPRPSTSLSSISGSSSQHTATAPPRPRPPAANNPTVSGPSGFAEEQEEDLDLDYSSSTPLIPPLSRRERFARRLNELREQLDCRRAQQSLPDHPSQRPTSSGCLPRSLLVWCNPQRDDNNERDDNKEVRPGPNLHIGQRFILQCRRLLRWRDSNTTFVDVCNDNGLQDMVQEVPCPPKESEDDWRGIFNPTNSSSSSSLGDWLDEQAREPQLAAITVSYIANRGLSTDAHDLGVQLTDLFLLELEEQEEFNFASAAYSAAVSRTSPRPPSRSTSTPPPSYHTSAV